MPNDYYPLSNHNAIGVALLDVAAIKEIAPVSEKTLKHWVKTGKFPAPVSVGTRVYWRSDEIKTWIKALTQHRNSAERATVVASEAIAQADRCEQAWEEAMGFDEQARRAAARLSIPLAAGASFAAIDDAAHRELARIENRYASDPSPHGTFVPIPDGDCVLSSVPVAIDDYAPPDDL